MWSPDGSEVIDVHAKQNRALEGALRHSHVPSLLSQSPPPSKVLLGTTPTFAIFPFSLLCFLLSMSASLGISLQWGRVCVHVRGAHAGAFIQLVFTLRKEVDVVNPSYQGIGAVSSIVAFSCKNNKRLTQISADSCEY